MLFGRPSPRDKLRYPASYSGGLTPAIMGDLFDAADGGELGPLNELINEICGKDALCKSLAEDRLSTVSDASLEVTPNPDDPSPARASELTVFAEKLLRNLKLYQYEQHDQDRVPVECGDLADVQQAFASPWKHGTGIYFVVWATAPGEPRPKPVGVEYVDVTRYRSQRVGSTIPNEGLSIETEAAWQGQPMWTFDPLTWFSLSASQPGLRPSLMGAGRSMVFPFWLKVGGSFTLSRILDKFGSPNIIGETSTESGYNFAASTGEDSRTELEAFLQNYQQDVTALFPKGFKPVILAPPQGAHDIAREVNSTAVTALRLAITGNEVTGSASAPGQAGVAGGASSVGERIQGRITAQDRRRTVQGLVHCAKRAISVWYGEQAALYCPVIKMADPTVARESTATSTNVAPTKTAAAPIKAGAI